MLVPAGAGASSGAPPGTPSSVSVERADGALTASWPAVEGATSHHVTYSSDGMQSWSLAAFDHLSASITFSVDNSDSYVVGVRARNAHGGSGWRNSSEAGPWTPPVPAPPDRPDSVSVTRADGTLTASWPAAAGATGYHVTYTSDGTQTWSLAAFDHPSSSITIDGADNDASYMVGVRARGAGGWSGWRNSSEAGPWTPPVPDRPASVSVERAPGVLEVSWPAVDGATGYHVTYTSDGAETWSLAAFDHPSSSITISASNDASYMVGVRARNAGGWSGWRNSPLASAYTPPAGPQNPTVEPGDGYLDFSWDAVSGAVSYDVRAKAQGAASWHGVASGVTATSYRYTTDVTLDYLSVRARSSGGAGPWADISRMPSAELQASYSSDTVAASSLSSSAGAQASAGLVSAAAQAESNTQLGQVTWGTITRETRSALANSTFRVNWTGVSGADGYNFVCSYWGGWHWDLCGWGTGTFGVAANYGTVPAAQAQPLIITHFWRKDGPGRPGKYSLPNRHMMLAVRAVKSGDTSAAGPWAQTEEIHPFFPNLREFSYSRGDGSITMSWTPNFWITGYEIDCAVSVPAGQTPAYTRCATLTGQNDNAAQHTATVSAGSTSYSIDNTKTYDIKITSTNKWSSGGWLAPLMSPITLTESNVTSTSASLTLAEYTGNWWLKQTTPGGADCTSMGAANATGSTADLTGLTPGISYTYKAYSDSACADEIVTVTFATA